METIEKPTLILSTAWYIFKSKFDKEIYQKVDTQYVIECIITNSRCIQTKQ